MGAEDFKILDSLTEKSLLFNIPKDKITQSAEANPKFEKNYDNFHVMHHPEPHAVRRKVILEKHPEMEKLFENREPFITLFFVAVIHVIQLLHCYLFYTYEASWKFIIFYALTIGAIFNHALFVLYHDITHFNCFRSMRMNQIAAIICNLPQILPSAIGFGRYHRDHHTYLGDNIKDPDIPTLTEVKMFQFWYTRLIYVFFMPFFYGLRPYVKAPKEVSFMEIVNMIACVLYAYFIAKFFTFKCVIYLLLSTYFGLSVHPVGAHVIAEHYEFFKSQDTYSYYGWMNYLNFNMGYHIEHHDFPNIPWHKLPQVRKIAPEFYNNLPQMNSYVTVIFKYIFDGSIGPWSRITLDSKDNSKDNKSN